MLALGVVICLSVIATNDLIAIEQVDQEVKNYSFRFAPRRDSIATHEFFRFLGCECVKID
jgi:uncharacterized membrane protein